MSICIENSPYIRNELIFREKRLPGKNDRPVHDGFHVEAFRGIAIPNPARLRTSLERKQSILVPIAHAPTSSTSPFATINAHSITAHSSSTPSTIPEPFLLPSSYAFVEELYEQNLSLQFRNPKCAPV
jgi:hypothetical protein